MQGDNSGQAPNQQSPNHQAAPLAPPSPARHGEPYRASDDRMATHASQPSPAYQPPAQQPGSTSRRADRIITIVLLAIGAFGALQGAYSLMTVGATMSDMATNVFGISGFVVPEAARTTGTVGAVVMLSLYALVLIFSIRRLRARKLTFWAPLAAGVISVILMFAFIAFALAQSPELMQAAASPDAIEQMMGYTESRGA